MGRSSDVRDLLSDADPQLSLWFTSALGVQAQGPMGGITVAYDGSKPGQWLEAMGRRHGAAWHAAVEAVLRSMTASNRRILTMVYEPRGQKVVTIDGCSGCAKRLIATFGVVENAKGRDASRNRATAMWRAALTEYVEVRGRMTERAVTLMREAEAARIKGIRNRTGRDWEAEPGTRPRAKVDRTNRTLSDVCAVVAEAFEDERFEGTGQ